jgi:hypothetical protein
MGVKLILNRFLIGKLEERGPFKRPREYGRKTLHWILRNRIRVDFEYSCFGRALNDILMNCVMYCKFRKFGECLDKLSNRWHLRKCFVLDVFSVIISSVLFGVVISSVLFFSEVHFSSLNNI